MNRFVASLRQLYRVVRERLPGWYARLTPLVVPLFWLSTSAAAAVWLLGDPKQAPLDSLFSFLDKDLLDSFRKTSVATFVRGLATTMLGLVALSNAFVLLTRLSTALGLLPPAVREALERTGEELLRGLSTLATRVGETPQSAAVVGAGALLSLGLATAHSAATQYLDTQALDRKLRWASDVSRAYADETRSVSLESIHGALQDLRVDVQRERPSEEMPLVINWLEGSRANPRIAVGEPQTTVVGPGKEKEQDGEAREAVILQLSLAAQRACVEAFLKEVELRERRRPLRQSMVGLWRSDARDLVGELKRRCLDPGSVARLAKRDPDPAPTGAQQAP